MILSNLLIVATAIFLPASLVVATPGAPSDPQVHNLGRLPRPAQALTPAAEISNYEAGQCELHVRVNEKCESPYAACVATIMSFTDSAGNVIKRPAESLPVMVDDEMYSFAGLGSEFWADVYETVASFTHGFESWTGLGPSHVGDFTCTSRGSTGTTPSRFQDVTCAFQCSSHHDTKRTKPQADGSKRTTTKRDDVLAMPNILNAEPVGEVLAQAGAGDVPYAHGWCSFTMQLFDQCVHNPQEKWHEEMLGMLTSIQDNDHKTVVEYPEGAGRIDQGAIRLLGMGDFRLAWSKQDKQIYFMFNNGWWASNTKHDPAQSFGYCNWTAWSKPDLVCIPEHGTHYRVSNMGCIFKC